MPHTVRARAGDTLCSIAVDHGFPDCQRLRDEAANADLVDRPLEAGDRVTVPDRRPREEEGRGTERRHRFRRRGVLRPRIRFVHGSPDLPFRDDLALRRLHVSNFRTDRGGANGTNPFPGGNAFHADGHADPDAFKVEVWNRSAPAHVDLELEALRPVYRPDGSVQRHEPFTGAERDRRKLDVRCERVGSATTTFRSEYLRLVADEGDQATVPGQTLLVTDSADGAAGDADAMEILDQRVRASIPIPTCPGAGAAQCRVAADLPVGDDPRRIRLCFHVFRTSPGGSAVGGTTETMLRRRTFKWFRRAYAQASLAPRLVDPTVRFLDPPSADMLVICQDHGRTASGSDGSGGGSTLSFRLGRPPATGFGSGLLNLLRPLTDPSVSVALTAGMTPLQMGQAVAAALPAGFSAQVSANARAFNAANGSCDVVVRHTDGRRVVIYDEASDDTRATVAVARVDVARVNSADTGNTLIPTTMEFRRLLRAADGPDDRLDCLIVGRFTAGGLRGRAFVPATDLGAGFRPPSPLRWAAIMGTTSSSGAVMDASDNLPFTFPHEAGHVLNDAFHSDNADPNGPTELMSGAGTSAANGVNATKRICDGPYTVRYGAFDPAQASPGDSHFANLGAVARFRTRGAPVMEPW